MFFKDFSIQLQRLEGISSRNEMVVVLADLLKELVKDEARVAMYLIQGRLVPKYVALEFNFSNKLAIRSLSEFVEVEKNASYVKSLYSTLGDAGLVAEKLLEERKGKGSLDVGPLMLSPSSLRDTPPFPKGEMAKPEGDNPHASISSVYAKLLDIAKLSGKGSQDEKMRSYANLVLSLDPLGAKYATRIIVGNLRLGLSDKTMLDSLSWFVAGDKSLREIMDLAFGARADIGELAEIIISSPKDKVIGVLENIKVEVGTPIASKLVEREANSQGVWKRMPNCYVQPKLDGLRGQVHFSKVTPSSLRDTPPLVKGGEDERSEAEGVVHIFSRNMEDMTEQFPEISRDITKLGVDSIILDSEILGFDEKTQKYLTYQETMQRKRKYDIKEYAKNIPVKAFCFDILYLNGEDLTRKPLEERLQILSGILKVKEDVTLQRPQDLPKISLIMLETKQVHSENELEEYFKEQVETNHLEGIITKQVGSTYEPGTRNFKWIKLKANTRSDLVDTIDVVVMGYYSGKGSRAKFNIGTLLTGVYNPKDDRFYSIGKVGSGFSEEDLKQMYIDLEKIRVKEMPERYVVDRTLYPYVWVEPKIIMEVTADEITRSPVHKAAIGVKTSVKKDDSSKGLSIRFPRMQIWDRDKELPNTVDEIVRMYELRKG